MGNKFIDTAMTGFNIIWLTGWKASCSVYDLAIVVIVLFILTCDPRFIKNFNLCLP